MVRIMSYNEKQVKLQQLPSKQATNIDDEQKIAETAILIEDKNQRLRSRLSLHSN